MNSKARIVGRLVAGALCLVSPLWPQSGAQITYVSGPNNCTTVPGYISYPYCAVPGEIPLGSFAVPGVGGTFTDPNFGGTVRIMTGAPYIHPYSLPSPISAHNKYLQILQRDSFRTTMLNLTTGAIAYDAVPFNGRAHVWDATNDDVYYLIVGAQIVKHTLSTNTDAIIVSYTGRFADINSGGSSEASKDNWLSFWAESEHNVCAVNLNTAQTYCADYMAADPNNRVGWNIDYSMITKGVDSVTGKRYVFLMADPALGAYSVNLAAGRLDFEYRGPELLDVSNGNHDGICDPGEVCLGAPHADLMEDTDGRQYMVTPKGNQEPCELDLVTYAISKGILLTNLESTGGGRHRVLNLANCNTSWPSYDIGCAKNAPYCVISMYSDVVRTPGDLTSPLGQEPHRNQIMVMRGNGLEVRFLGMSRTVSFNDDAYWPQPRAAISNDGAWVVFDSNYGVDNGERVSLMTTGFNSTSPPPPTSTGIWSGATINPDGWYGDPEPVTLGMKFRSDVGGTVSGIRFYKGSGDTGTHMGLLYTASGTLLAQASFSNESGSGWQTATFSSPVSLTANTTYIAAYFTTMGYSYSHNFFSSHGVDNGSLHALQSNTDSGGNGVYQYGSSPQFPVSTWQDSNYWVDIVFDPGSSTPPPPQLSLYSGSVSPDIAWYPDPSPVTLGLKFRSDVAATVTGLRFWKGAAGNNGTHIGLLYSASGQLLAQASFVNESSSGWQTVTFSTPVSIAANTIYIAAYFTTSGYGTTRNYFTSAGVDNGVLHAPQSSISGGNMVYWYGSTPQFPNNTWQDSNYFVDVLVSVP